MKTPVLTKNDYYDWGQNKQDYLVGDGEVKSEKSVYFISDVLGTDVTISDKDSNALFTVSNYSFSRPLRLEGGFEASGTNTFIVYHTVSKGAI